MSSVNNSINVTEKRIKKSVERLGEFYEKGVDTIKNRKSLISCGSGIYLGVIERVKDAFNRTKIDKQILKYIYLLCYKTRGKASKRNSEIKKFNGFNERDDSKSEFIKRLMLCEKIPLGSLRIICDLFNIPVTGKQKKDISIGLVTFLQCPAETGSNVFRTSALRRKTKSKQKKNNIKTLKPKKKVLPEDFMDKLSIDSLSESFSEEIIIPKTKRLEKLPTKRELHEGTTTESVKTEETKLEDVEKIKLAVSKREVEDGDITKSIQGFNPVQKLSKVDILDGDGRESLKVADEKATKIGTQIDKIADRILKKKKLSMKKERLEDEKIEESETNEKSVTILVSKNLKEVVAQTAKVPRKKIRVERESKLSPLKNDISDEKFRTKITKILKEADLTTTTLNQVCDQVIGEFPGVDLIGERYRIKELVKKVIEEN